MAGSTDRSTVARTTREWSVILVMVVLAVTAILVGVGTADMGTLAMVLGASLLVPCLAAVISLRAGLFVLDVTSWAVPSWLAFAVAMSFPVFPAVIVPFLVGMGLSLLMLFSQSARGFWYRHVLRAGDRAR